MTKMEKKNNNKNLINIAVIVIIGIFILILVFGAYKSFQKKDTQLYFNAGTQLPDETLELKRINLSKSEPINVLETGKEYEIIFTIIPGEKGEYRVMTKSSIYRYDKKFNLDAGEEKVIRLTVLPIKENKWKLNSTEQDNISDTIDITANSWLGEKQKFNILMENGVPSIIKPDYNLPISSNISSVGEIYHMNVTLDELRRNPFNRHNEVESIKGEVKEVISENISMHVKGDKFYFRNNKKTNEYILNQEIFLIKVIKENKGYEVNEESGFKETNKLSFRYMVK